MYEAMSEAPGTSDAVGDAIRLQAAAVPNDDGEERWAAFEQADDPAMKYDFSVPEGESHRVTALLTFITVTTFLAGFAVTDFGSFSRGEWTNEEGQEKTSGYAFLVIMAWVSGNSMYLSVLGVMNVAVYYRAKNQPGFHAGSWEQRSLACVQPITPALSKGDGLKGRRRQTFGQALKAVVEANPDWQHTVALSGLDIQSKVMLHNAVSAGSETWTVSWQDPPTFLADSERSTSVLGTYTFPVTIMLYILAQALKALREMDMWVVVAVAGILGFWMSRMAMDLRGIYAKLND